MKKWDEQNINVKIIILKHHRDIRISQLTLSTKDNQIKNAVYVGAF